MRHTCQSSLVRCALRGQHPRYVLYLWDGIWMLLTPLNGHLVRVFDASTTTTDRAMRIARNIALRHGRWDR